jgi:CSLREA domain-containing protein
MWTFRQFCRRALPFRLFLTLAGALLLMVAFAPRANADLIAYYNFEGAATLPFPVNATSHAPAFFDGSDPQHSSTLVATNLSSADMSAEAGLPLNQTGSNTSGLGFHKTASHSPADLDMPLSSAHGFQDMTLSFAISNSGNGYSLVKFSYSTNGGGLFTQFGPAGGVLIATSLGQVISQSVPAAANNAPSLVLRIEFSGPQSNGADLQNVIDNIQVNGTIPPSVYVVTKTDDTNDGTCDADCSLREAITAANAHRPADEITFGVTGTILLQSALPNLSDDVTITGPGANVLTVQRAGGTCSDNAASCTSTNLTQCGNPATAVCIAFRIFTVNSGKTVTISGLTIANGSEFNGGGIYNDHATLTISNCTISGNSATNAGGGIYNNGSGGGGNATLHIVNSTISGNSPAPGGFAGGGIFNDAESGGSAALTVINSTISGNSASYGGGIDIAGTGNLTAMLLNSTLSNNTATIAGGGVYNSFATLEIGGTIFNASSIESFSGTITSDGYNLSSDAAGGDGSTSPGGFLNGTGDIRNTDPMLDPNGLQDNGGPTLTIALQPGSPAIDKAKNFTTLTTDQRGPGFARTVDKLSIANATGGDGTDIGAFEVQNTPPTITGATISRRQGAPRSSSHVATVSDNDDLPTSLTVTVNGGTSAVVNDVTVSNIAIDNSGDVTADVIALCSASNATFTLRVTDTTGFYAEATLVVNVKPNNPPVITTPGSIDAIAQKKKVKYRKGAFVSFNVSAVDPEDGPVRATASPLSGSFFPIGSTTVTVTATDHCGNTATAFFSVNVANKK